MSVRRIDWVALRTAAIEAVTGGSYRPYSNFGVGAAGLAKDGRIFTGSNVENASYGMTLCAECGMISELVKEGCARELVAVHVVHVRADGSVQIITPCGRCRQLIFEHGGCQAQIMGSNGKPRSMKYFLPDAFGPETLEKAS